MSTAKTSVSVLFGLPLLLAVLPAAAQGLSTPTKTVNAMNALWGQHDGRRAVHAKGIIADGVFTPTPEAAALSTSNLFHSAKSPVRVRFSDFTGAPSVADASSLALPHGMSMRFRPEGGAETDVVTNSFDRFPVATGEEFLLLLQALAASGPGAAKPTKFDQFTAGHPAVKLAFASAKTPTSFARQRYNGLNAFVFVDADGRRQPFRVQFVPVAGVALMDAATAASADPDVLMNELRQRVAAGPVEFRMVAQLAAPGDAANDATKPWPQDRRRVVLGTLTLDRLPAEQEPANADLELLPTRLAPGIQVSNDPLIRARAQTYDISIGRRERAALSRGPTRTR